MDIETKLEEDYKAAMRAKNRPLVQAIRQVRAKIQEASHAPGIVGPMTEALRQRVIAGYVKQLEKSCEELSAGGERGAVLVAQYRAEVAYLTPLLPQPMNDAALLRAVATQLERTGVTDPRQAGKVLGALMKAHPGAIDAKRAKAAVDAALAAGAKRG